MSKIDLFASLVLRQFDMYYSIRAITVHHHLAKTTPSNKNLTSNFKKKSRESLQQTFFLVSQLK